MAVLLSVLAFMTQCVIAIIPLLASLRKWCTSQIGVPRVNSVHHLSWHFAFLIG